MKEEKKEEKKVTKKTTTSKKTNSEKKESVKKVTKTTAKKTVAKKVEAKKEPVKKVASKSTVKKVTTPKVAKKEEPKVDKKVEIPVVKEEIKEQKVVTKNTPENKASDELLEIRKKRYIVETIIVAVLVLIALVLLCNKTFLKVNYKTDFIDVDIPRFSYYVSDKDNTVKFTTLRKSDYLKEYYNEYLEGFIFYSCASGNNTFYYNDKTKTLIKEIEVEKKFIVKTIKITYDIKSPEEYCGLR